MARTLVRPKPGFRVDVVRIEDATELLAIGPGHVVWSSEGEVLLSEVVAFVRLRPPASCPAWRVEELRKWIADRGATVRVEREGEDDPTPEVMHETIASPESPLSGAREVVEAMVAESKSGAGDELAVFVEDVMKEAGL